MRKSLFAQPLRTIIGIIIVLAVFFIFSYRTVEDIDKKRFLRKTKITSTVNTSFNSIAMERDSVYKAFIVDSIDAYGDQNPVGQRKEFAFLQEVRKTNIRTLDSIILLKQRIKK